MGFPKSKFANRKSTLKKKAAELAALCGAEVCVICLDANGCMETWPEDVNKVKATILKYNHTVQATKKKAKTKTKVKAAADENNSLNLCSNGIMWDGNLENLSKESLTSLSNCLEAKIQTLDYKTDHHDGDQIPCAGPIDDGFDDLDMYNPDLMTNNCCTMVTVDQFDQLQPPIPLATDLPPLPMEFSDNATTMAASQSLSNCNHIIDDVGNTIGIFDYDDGDQYWHNPLGADLETTDPDLGSQFNFLMEEYSKEICCPNFPTDDNFCLPMNRM